MSAPRQVFYYPPRCPPPPPGEAYDRWVREHLTDLRERVREDVQRSSNPVFAGYLKLLLLAGFFTALISCLAR